MFLNIKIEQPQRDLHRFIAFGKTLHQTALMFGEASSPYLALETVQVHSKLFEQKFKKAAAVVQKDLYMDDTISGDQDDANVIATIQEIVEFFRLMHLKVHKINSNSTNVLQALDPELLENQEVTTVLGILWDTIDDTLVPQPPQHKPCGTKRGVLSFLAGHYDPMGLEAPLTCKGKLVMQELWL